MNVHGNNPTTNMVFILQTCLKYENLKIVGQSSSYKNNKQSAHTLYTVLWQKHILTG